MIVAQDVDTITIAIEVEASDVLGIIALINIHSNPKKAIDARCYEQGTIVSLDCGSWGYVSPNPDSCISINT